MTNNPNNDTEPISVFLSYASADERHRVALEKHLSMLRLQGVIAPWHRRLIIPGTDWQNAIDHHLLNASIILLLISADFLASEYCYSRELQIALKRHEDGLARVFPILLRPVEWDGASFGYLEPLPQNRRPVTSWRNRDEAFQEITRGIRHAINILCISPRTSSTPVEQQGLPDFSLKLTSVPFMAPDLPPDFIQRPNEYAAAKSVLLREASEQQPMNIVALYGAGGGGKTILACALCHDSEVQATFSNGILWINIGEQTAHLTEEIEGVVYVLNGNRLNFASTEEAVAKLNELMINRSYLIIIDDLWRASDLMPFLNTTSQCSWLITTRNTNILPPTVERVQVAGMHLNEGMELLCAGLDATDRARNEQRLQALLSLLGNWPLALTLVNAILRERVDRMHQSLSLTLDYLQKALDKSDRATSMMNPAQERKTTLAKTIEWSLSFLDPHERVRYEELAIFPEDATVPLHILHRWWQATGGLNELETEELCYRFYTSSLILSVDFASQQFRLHDAIRDYLREQLGVRLLTLYQQFCEAMWPYLLEMKD